MTRDFCHVREAPMHGDIVEIIERCDDGDGNVFDAEIMLRVIWVAEDHVWFKEYGKGRPVCSLRQWKERLGQARVGKMIRPSGDADIPF